MENKVSIKEKLLSKIIKTKECWIWTGHKNHKGYGVLWDSKSKKLKRTHRLSFETFNGKIKDKLHVLHRCDNPSCINPLHLFLGTNSDNQKDAVKKGRHWHSNKKYCAKGHPYSGNNLYLRKQGYRECKVCMKESWTKNNKKRYSKLKALTEKVRR
jgi:hypothetical protein